MKLLPLVPGVTRSLWQDDTKAKAVSGRDDGDDALKATILERDRFTCRYCGFKAKKYQQLHYLNGNVSDTRPSNLVTACVFCHQVLRLDLVSPMRSGTLIWLPEVGQASFHHLCRAIYIARITSGHMAKAARQVYDLLMARREAVKARLGTDDPSVLTAVMQDFLEDDEYEDRAKKLDGVRLMPLDRRIVKDGDLEFNQFPQILAFWRSKDGPFTDIMPAKWEGMFEEMKQTVSNRAS